ncbi:cobalamin biosynthesis protein CobW [Aeromicrobium sp. PE09-221]|uniref:CobW family GTP-binding protein n=1 Tax=Aeromicrobium sp. PE09-221 TaxID=1898043 RepID=UPI000B6EC0FB|nr:GTP-binding protein [Aeromicrobium sp. PE09-221]OUZ10530.1 cobalamin biosynthesis protein CobW [Aeromicrobium sp. PE09-221]
MTTPVAIVTGTRAEAVERTVLTLAWDTPGAVAVHHTIDVAHQTLTRVVADRTGIVEREEIDLDHACASCALREDILPTLARLARTERWTSIVAHLPISADATGICRVIDYDPAYRDLLRISEVIAVVDGPEWENDLLGDDLLIEREIHTSAEDGRSVAETLSSLIEYADTVLAVGELPEEGVDLISVLARPGARLVPDHLTYALDPGRTRHHDAAEDWVDPMGTRPIGLIEHGTAWTVELRSERPFHPARLREHIAELGGGPRRSRGCFWLASRPGQTCEWSGAGGQLSVGTALAQPDGPPHTRLLVTGLDDEIDELVTLFHRCLVTDEEIARRGLAWSMADDGFDPWLGPIQRAA